MNVLIYDCHKNKIVESEKIRDAFLLADKTLKVSIVEARKFEFPSIDEYDIFAISGADTSSERHAYARQLREQIEQIIQAKKPLLGICFGSQIVGEVFGAEVYKLENAEIGWRQVEITPSGKNDKLFFGLPNPFIVFQYHTKAVRFNGETSYHVLAKTPDCIQAVRYNDITYGVQFHAEESPKSGTAYLEYDPHCTDFHEAVKLKPKEYVEWQIFKNFLDVVKK
ncbi:TPA: type 1 glutamine amidotransferase [archaeon]|uniref:Type 1 glutamine amidotransferase n=1 Tax=Candidatus Naiadarchaeum limnaeum TaxID=2756139 RepID=A0A832V514_9ARCH|nr:type 1 glutamine amidotransferase [Candidatus Naiadarchaeum limnaeum]